VPEQVDSLIFLWKNHFVEHSTRFQKYGRNLIKRLQSDTRDSGIQITTDANKSAMKNKLESKGNRKQEQIRKTVNMSVTA
jgi:hypothetical protein